MDRMTVHNARTLLYPGQYELAHLRLTERIAEVDRNLQNTVYTSERQAYVKLLIEQVKRSRVYGGPSGHAMRRSVFQNHAGHFQALTGEQKAVLHIRASAHRKSKIDDLLEARRHLQDETNLLHLRHIEEQKAGVVNHLNSVRFDVSDYSRFFDLWEQGVAANILNQTWNLLRQYRPRLKISSRHNLPNSTSLVLLLHSGCQCSQYTGRIFMVVASSL